jgi:hypothetical protein
MHLQPASGGAMTRAFARRLVSTLTFSLLGTFTLCAQEPSEDRAQQQSEQRPRLKSRDVLPDEPANRPDEPIAPAPEPARPTHPADGRREPSLPEEAYAVVPGTKFLVRLEDELDTKETREKQHFRAKTLEPMTAGNGIYLPSGAEIRGHVSRVEPAGVAGRAKLWLTFDEIRTRFGTLPIVAEVISVPGDHSVRTGNTQKEGLIEGRTSTQQAAAEAAAAGAFLGAAKGVRDHDKREIAEGAAAAAIAAYLIESGRGHDIDLPKGSKLELELERALYLLKD